MTLADGDSGGLEKRALGNYSSVLATDAREGMWPGFCRFEGLWSLAFGF